MRLVDEWQWIIRKAWSVKLLAIAAILTGFETYNQIIIALELPPPLPPGLFALAAGVVSFAALIARFIAQTRE